MFTFFLAPLLLLFSTSPASANEANPIGKVVELLDALKTRIDDNGEADSAQYRVFVNWYTNASSAAKLIKEETEDKVSELQEGLAQDKAKIEELTKSIEEKAGELAKTEQELAEATAERRKEHENYTKDNEMYVTAIDQLTRALEVLAKEQPSEESQGPSAAALVEVAKKLRMTLVQGTDFHLSEAQKETLNMFVHIATRQHSVSQAPNFLQLQRYNDVSVLAPDFLQTEKQEQPEVYGEYESQSGGVEGTLESLKDKTNSEREAAMKAEEEAETAFNTLSDNLQQQIGNLETTLGDLKTQLSETQGSASIKEADLDVAQKLLKTTTARLEELKTEYVDKTNNYKARTEKRSNELLAVQEAQVILTSEAAKRFMANQTIGTPDFLQIHQEHRMKALHLMKHANSQGSRGLVLLALQSQTTHSADPFAKVKGLIQQMLEKLLDEANQEAQEKAFCDSEMSKNEKSREDKQMEVTKHSDKIANLEAEIEMLTSEIEQLHVTLSELSSDMEQATKVRQEEKLQAEATIESCKDAREMLGRAVKALKDFYEGEAAKDPDTSRPKSEQYEVESGAASGIIGILEVAIQDFTDQEEAAELEETKAAETFKALKSQTEISVASFEKDLEYKSRSKVKKQSETVRTNSDLKSYEGELQAVEKYLEELKKRCIATPETYEERKRRREAELASLKEALAILKGEAMA